MMNGICGIKNMRRPYRASVRGVLLTQGVALGWVCVALAGRHPNWNNTMAFRKFLNIQVPFSGFSQA
jgi:hypothetical protein